MLLIRNKKRKSIFLLGAMVFMVFNLYFALCASQGHVSDFNVRRDKKGMLNIFEQNWKALTGEELFSPGYVENIIKTRKPDAAMPSIEPMHIKVMREGDKFAGFTAYYMENLEKGMVLFLVVGHDFRGKGYGKILMQKAIKDLLAKGSKKIGIWVAETNMPARRIYEGLGFSETPLRQGKVIYLEYCP